MIVPREQIIETRNWVFELNKSKHIHYRELHPEITHDDYQTCTKVDFEPIENEYENIQEMWGRLWNNFKGQIVTSHSSKGRSKSRYFTTEDGYVYRKSDHWGIVKSCLWTLNGKGNFNPRVMLSGPMEIGRAHLSDFKIHRYGQDRKIDIFLNPEWVEQITTILPFTNYLLKMKQDPEFNDLDGKDKELIGKWGGFFKNQLLSVENLEYSKKEHIFV
jgi:hypothetical protein